MRNFQKTIGEATTALQRIQAETLSPAIFQDAEAVLRAIPVEDLIADLQSQLPPKPVEDEEGEKQVEYERACRAQANEVNRIADGFHDELKRIRQLRETLSLERLDPILHLARQIIRPIYTYSAALLDASFPE